MHKRQQDPEYMVSDAHTERSRLINDYKIELRALEKERKKKKPSQKIRDEIQVKIDALNAEHEAQLAKFDKSHDIQHKKKIVDHEIEEAKDEANQDVPDIRNHKWNGLSKTDLMQHCASRNLSKKGNREELVCRLTIWSMEHPEANEDANSTVPKYDVPQFESYQPPMVTNTNKKDEFREKRKKLWKRRTHVPLREKSSSNEVNSELDKSEDVPEEELVKQKKRRDVVGAILVKLLCKHPTGIHIDNICDKLKEAKVVNFTPQLLGYESLEEWIMSQPRSVLSYNKHTNVIYPSNVGQLPPSDEESDEE